MTAAAAHRHAQTGLARILLVMQEPRLAAVLGAEMMRRGASVAIEGEISAAAAAVRRQTFDAILVKARESDQATLLLLQLLRAEALGAPRVLLLVDPDRGNDLLRSPAQADTLLAASLRPELIAEAAGLAPEVEPLVSHQLPAAIPQPRAKVLALPAPLARDQLPEGVANVERGEVPDLVILTAAGADAALSAWMSTAAAAVVPVVDASGSFRERADLAIPFLAPQAVADALARLGPLTTRMRALPERFFRTRDPKAMLLARLAIRERSMHATRDVNTRDIVRYPDSLAVAGAPAAAEALSRLGFLKKTFFEKVQCCPSCSSARLLVREECSQCRSADVVEEPIIHHLRCGYQGPERDFRQGRDLVCPKCRHHLEHFSVDYDKPGSLVVCNSCGHTTGEAEVGFHCLDCDTGFAADKAVTRTFHEFTLTEEGRAAAWDPPMIGQVASAAEPEGIRDRLRRFLAENERAGRPCAALMIKIDPDGNVRAKAGPKRFDDAVALYASLLREVFETDVDIVEAGQTFLVLVGGETAAAVETALPDLRRELEQHLAIDLMPRYSAFGPEALRALL